MILLLLGPFFWVSWPLLAVVSSGVPLFVYVLLHPAPVFLHPSPPRHFHQRLLVSGPPNLPLHVDLLRDLPHAARTLLRSRRARHSKVVSP